jgi:biopolymer transport protein ExbB
MSDLLHQLSFGLMILAALVVVVVSLERIIYSAVNMRRAEVLHDSVDEGLEFLERHLGKDTVSEMVRHLMRDRASGEFNPEERQNRADAAYLHARDEMSLRLWLLDTAVTAAPLLGLLGTIFGIVETFLALSSSGMSDPGAVSAGIGTALYATALGISIALVGIVTFNYLTDRNERIGERLKMLILKLVN